METQRGVGSPDTGIRGPAPGAAAPRATTSGEQEPGWPPVLGVLNPVLISGFRKRYSQQAMEGLHQSRSLTGKEWQRGTAMLGPCSPWKGLSTASGENKAREGGWERRIRSLFHPQQQLISVSFSTHELSHSCFSYFLPCPAEAVGSEQAAGWDFGCQLGPSHHTQTPNRVDKWWITCREPGATAPMETSMKGSSSWCPLSAELSQNSSASPSGCVLFLHEEASPGFC